MKSTFRPSSIVLVTIALLAASACGPRVASRAAAPDAAATSPRASAGELGDLVAARTAMKADGDGYRIGPGDVIDVTVYALPDMNKKVRVREQRLRRDAVDR